MIGNKKNTSSLKSVTVRRENGIFDQTEPIDTILFGDINESKVRLQEKMFAYKRVKNSEVILSQAIFIELGLCQPAWVAIEANHSYSHVAIAYMQQVENESQEIEVEVKGP